MERLVQKHKAAGADLVRGSSMIGPRLKVGRAILMCANPQRARTGPEVEIELHFV
jgi:hypothetical protein